MKASDYIVDFLIEQGIDTVFGYMGGMITHIAESIYQKSPAIKFISTYHEQSAAFASIGYARHTRTTGVAIATSGPGATNLITGIADAYFDSIPVIFITGQVNTYEYKYDNPIRQVGFQELNIVATVKPYVKYAKLVDRVEDLPEVLARAYKIANHGRKGPVLLDIPMNIQRGEINDAITTLEHISIEDTLLADCDNQLSSIDDALEMIRNAQRPLVLIGGGVKSANIANDLHTWLENTGLYFVSSLHGKSSCNEYHDNYLGCIGSYGNRCANIAMATTDLLIVLGARLDIRQVGGKPDSVALKGQIIHFDIDINELVNHKIKTKINVLADLKELIVILNHANIAFNKLSLWSKKLNEIKFSYNQTSEIKRNIKNHTPYTIFEILNKIAEDDAVYSADVGQNQMWAMQMLKLSSNQEFYTSGGFGAMGCSIPIAVGSAFGSKSKKQIYAICGDGGLHMSLQSIMLISQYNLPIKIILINNQALGMITQFQELYFNKNMVGTCYNGGYITPNFEMVAKSYNIPYIKCDTTLKELSTSTDKLVEYINLKANELNNHRNCIFEYIILEDSRVYPKLEYNQPIYNPSPATKNIEAYIDGIIESNYLLDSTNDDYKNSDHE